jgi:DNA-directed RNA polymerase II subunit RPB2
MTIGHLIECILAKAACQDGIYPDGTPWTEAGEGIDHEKLSEVLPKHGFDANGDEIMYNGITGEQMSCEIFIGPTYYFRLKHMVADKVNFRLDGQVVGMTKQPTKGRGNNGGLRIGEMETNALIAHGVSSFTKESLMERSDKYSMFISKKDGCIVPYNRRKRIETEACTQISVPYSFKLLTQEMQAMSVEPRLITSEMDAIAHDEEEADVFWGLGNESSDSDLD